MCGKVPNWPGVAESSVLPSAGALATMAVPIAPPPPPRLSTTTVAPISRAMGTAYERATISALPPGANGTTRVRGLPPRSWARTAPQARAAASAQAARSFIIFLSPMRVGYRVRRPVQDTVVQRPYLATAFSSNPKPRPGFDAG